MKLNTRGRYGVRLLTELARQESAESPLGLRTVAARTGLPIRYLEQIVRPLRRAGLIRSRTGRTGGYCLSRPSASIQLKDVFEAATGPLRLIGCVDDPATCRRSAGCPTREVWQALTDDLRAVMARYTLHDLACSGSEPCADRESARRRSARRRRRTARAAA
jgi:Rrf2 family protein